jgi:hypothetical protein
MAQRLSAVDWLVAGVDQQRPNGVPLAKCAWLVWCR